MYLIVQSWVSILIAVYGGALAVFSRRPFVSFEYVTWSANLCTAICGWAADASSNRGTPLLLGLLALGPSTMMLHLGRSISILIVGRILQGISAAIVWCVGLALVADTADTSRIGESMSYVFMAMSVAALAGPLLSGIVFDRAGYNAVFAMAYGLFGIDIIMRLFMIEQKEAVKWLVVEREVEKKIDRSSSVSNNANSTPARHSSEMAISERVQPAPSPDKTSQPQQSDAVRPPTRAPTSKTTTPAMVTLMKSKRLMCALWATFATTTLITQFDSVLPLFVRDTFGWSSTAAGLVFLPLVVPALFSPMVGSAIDRFGTRLFAVTGFVAIGCFEVLLRLVTRNTFGQKVLLCFLLTMIGIAFNLCTPPLMIEIIYVVEHKEQHDPGLFGSKSAYAQAYGLFNFACAAGFLVGPIWGGFVQDKMGWGTMTWSMALLSFVTAVPVALWTGGSIGGRKKRNCAAK